jgi:putative ABC transport system ATP-binding protein
VIELTAVNRTYQVGSQPVRALCDIDLTIEDAEYVAIMGPSGSGKSTLLNILGCLDRPSTGSYRLDGQDVSQLPDTALSHIRARRIGFVFQTFHLVPRLTAAANVELPLIFAGVPRAERASRVRDALARVGLTARGTHRPDQLSGGERQRVALARAIVMGPSILLADEPTGNLDRASGRDVIALLEALNANGITLIIVTHDPSLGERARRLIRLVDGALDSDIRQAPRQLAEVIGAIH